MSDSKTNGSLVGGGRNEAAADLESSNKGNNDAEQGLMSSQLASGSPRTVHGISVWTPNIYAAAKASVLYAYHLDADKAGQWLLVILGTLSSILLYALDNTITADVIPVGSPDGLISDINHGFY